MGTGSGGKSGLTQGPFEFGPSQFDTNAIMAAIGGNEASIQARYNQLGMGGSTPEQQDLSQQNLLGQAAQGQLQTSEVGQAAFNPALQTPTTNQSGTVVGSAIGAGISGLGKLLG